MATLEEKIVESITRQLRQYQEEYQKMARVTLLETYAHNSGVVTMRHGSTAARYPGQSVDGEDDEVIDLTRAVRKPIPGRPIHYHLSFEGVKEMRCACQDEPFDIDKTIIVPLPTANLWFGNWQKFSKIYGAGENPDTEDTMAFQKRRVGNQWGGYAKRRRSPQNYTPNDWRTLESIAIPPVPNVSIVRLDTQLKKIPNSEFIPWEVYKFHDDIVPDRWTENPSDKIMQVTESQFEALVAAAVAKQMAGSPLTRKAG